MLNPEKRTIKKEKRERAFLHSGEERVQHLIENGFEEEARIYEKVIEFAQAVKDMGGKSLLVGGSIRDEILGIPCKDYDIEVYNIEPQKLTNLTQTFGKTKEVGASFGILKLDMDGFDIDISLPRRESTTGDGHKDFSVTVDPYMSVEEASRRRDFTFGAIGKDIITGEIYDFFNGVKDLEERKLCMVDEETFTDDPLRVLRGVQFVGRFGLFIEDETMRVMRETRDKMKSLPKDRFAEEWEKLLLRSRKPSLGLNAAMEIGIFHTLHAETCITDLPLTPQEKEWHPEGDVWIHTLMVVDEAAKIAEEERLSKQDALILLLAAFCHDLGKPETTKMIDGKITSHGHEPAGVGPTEKFLYEIGIPGKTREVVKKLVAEHLVPSTLYKNEVEYGQTITDGAFKKLKDRLYPATIKQLVLLAKADNLGRGPFVDPDFPERSAMPTDYPAGEWLLKRFEDVMGSGESEKSEKSRPIITGRDLIALKFKPGVMIGQMIRLAEDMHAEGGLSREEILSKINQCIYRHTRDHDTSPQLEDVFETLQKEHEQA